MLIDSPGVSRDVLAGLIGDLPSVRLVPAEPEVIKKGKTEKEEEK